MQLYIPKLGSLLTLKSEWRFFLHIESRNSSLCDKLCSPIDCGRIPTYQLNSMSPVVATLPAQTVLKVDRIYIRANQKSFDSVTFRIVSCPHKLLEKARFWAKLDNVNEMEIEDIN